MAREFTNETSNSFEAYGDPSFEPSPRIHAFINWFAIALAIQFVAWLLMCAVHPFRPIYYTFYFPFFYIFPGPHYPKYGLAFYFVYLPVAGSITYSMLAGLVATLISKRRALSSKKKANENDLRSKAHTCFQICTLGCIVVFVGWFAFIFISTTYFPSDKEIAFRAVASDDIERLESVIAMVGMNETQAGSNIHDHLTLLNVAVVESSPQIVSLLLENGSDPNHQGSWKQFTPLHRTVYLREKPGKIEIIKLLITYGADPKLADDSGASPIEWARMVNPKLVDVLSWRPNEIAE